MDTKTDFSENNVLIEHLKNGDEKAYMFLLDTYHRRLHAYALTLIDDYSMAQDIVQNVFLKTWKFRKKLNNNYSIKNFLYKSIYNEFINEYHKNKSMMLLQQQYFDSLTEIMEDTDSEALDTLINMVSKEMMNLPPKCQKIFTLSKKEGLTNSEISTYLNISVKAVEAQITKAYGIIRNKLDDKYKAIFFIFFMGRKISCTHN